MDANEQLAHFDKDLEDLVQRYRAEYDLSYGSVVGALFMKASELSREAHEDESEE